MAIRRWIQHRTDPEAVSRISSELNIGILPARVLAARGYTDPESARAFLNCSSAVLDPLARKDMDRAARRIREAIENDEKIAIYGDYDADGLTATTLMYRCLSGFGAEVVCALPSREGSGYGLSKEVLEHFKNSGVSLVVTVDNGISAYDEAAYARELGISMVITDHHMAREELPIADAVVNPHRLDDTSMFKDIAGVGVALELAAVLEDISMDEAIERYGVLATIGTIGDIMPLLDENRYIVSRSIREFSSCDLIGLRALCETVGLSLDQMDESNVAYTIAPRLNAAGRMGDAEMALSLLLTEDQEEAKQLAEQLETLNRQRQDAEAETTRKIQQYFCDDPGKVADPLVFIAGEDFHPGVMGIVCSRLVDIFDKPAIVIAIDGDTAKGSGRSISGFSLFDMISSCSDLMEKFGGHDMAAGFTMQTRNVPVLKERLFAYCKLHAGEFRLPELNIEAEVQMSELNERDVEQLRCLAPFGSANKEPNFVIRNAVLTGIYPLGERHTRIGLKQGGQQMYAAYFGVCPEAFEYSVGQMLDVVVNLSIYHGQNWDCVSLRVCALSSSSFRKEDLDSYEEYRRLCFSGHTDCDALRCTRNDAALVYRRLKQENAQLFTERRLCGKFGDLPLGKILTLIRVFSELGFITIEPENRAAMLRIVPDAPKRDLMDSPTFRAVTRD